MSKWATINKDKLEWEINKLSARIDEFRAKKDSDGNLRVSPKDAPYASRLLAQHDALVCVFNCLE